MTVRHLQIFLEVAKCGNMTTAAKNLYISQPTVSQAIAEIESMYHVRLFSRLSKRLYITISGEQLLEYAERIISLHNEMDQMMRSKQIVRLRLGASLVVGACIFSDIVSSYQTLHPEVETRITVDSTNEIEDLLLHGKLDIALVDGQIKSTEIICESVISNELMLVCRSDHPFADKEFVTAQELDRLPMILQEKQSSMRKALEEFMAAQGCEVDCAWSCRNTDAIKSAVAAGQGLALLSIRLLQRELDSGLLNTCRIQGFDSQRNFSLAYHKNKRHFLYFTDFLDICRNYEKTSIS